MTAPALTSSPVEAFVEALLTAENAERRRILIESNSLSEPDRRDAVNRLLDEARGLFGAEPGHMERVSFDALTLADKTNDAYLRATARMVYGDGLRSVGRNADAAALFDDAAARFKALGRPVEAARTRIGWIDVTARLGKLAQALRAIPSARRTLVEKGEMLAAARLETTAGGVCNQHGLYRQALAHYTRALKLHVANGGETSIGAARSHSNRGSALTHLGRYHEALTELELARDAHRKNGLTNDAATVTTSIAEHEMLLGRYAAALVSFEAASKLYEAAGQPAASLFLANDLADCYLNLGRPAEALSVLDGVEEQLETTDDAAAGLAVAVRRVAALLLLGRKQEAMSVLEKGERAFPEGLIQHHAWLACQRSSMLLSAGEPSDGLDAALDAQQLARSGSIRALMAESLMLQAQSLFALGRLGPAATAARRGRRYALRLGSPALLCWSLEIYGRLAEARGRSALARRHYGAAVDQLERQQREVIFELRDTFDLRWGKVYESLAALQLEAGDATAAFFTAERAKSRALANVIAGKVELRPRGNARLRSIEQELRIAQDTYAGVRAQSFGGRPPGERLSEHDLAPLEKKIADLTKQLQLESHSNEIGDLYGARQPGVLPKLPPDTALVEFFSCGSDLMRFFVAGPEVQGKRLQGAAMESERLLRAFRLNLDLAERAGPERHQELARQAKVLLQRLHSCLLDALPPLAQYRSLIVVPHGALHYVPFHALHDGSRYLIEQFAVSYAPSAALYSLCSERGLRRKGESLVLGHSAGGSLPSTLSEAKAVGEVLCAKPHLEASATRRLIMTAARSAKVMHIAAHGQFRADAPLFSAIELADGPLTTADVFGLDLRAPLVVLSACETGRAVVGGGDELVGLARAFLYAGAAGLLVSQWRVDDEATAELMKGFHKGLIARSGGPEALRAAQILAISRGIPQNGTDHPLFWAGFQFIGAS